MRAPFRLERYLRDLCDRTAWAQDCAVEPEPGSSIDREALHRIAHLWALALLDDRFDELLLPVLATQTPLLDALDAQSREHEWGLDREFFRERLESGACLLLIDGVEGVELEWPRNRCFRAGP